MSKLERNTKVRLTKNLATPFEVKDKGTLVNIAVCDEDGDYWVEFNQEVPIDLDTPLNSMIALSVCSRNENREIWCIGPEGKYFEVVSES